MKIFKTAFFAMLALPHCSQPIWRTPPMPRYLPLRLQFLPLCRPSLPHRQKRPSTGTPS